ncbi:MAG TPA: AI-2E family transporter [Anaeromyxobacteraceae bacterium]|nr:AI-2E family transporter [Anaeromyxobacteraceae bacterium]
MASLRQFFRDPKARLWTLTGILWALALVVIVLTREVLLPFVLAALAAYVIDPVIVRLSRLRLRDLQCPRWAAVVAVYLTLGLGIWLVGVSILPQVYREAVRGLGEAREFLASVTPERIDGWAQTIDGYLQRVGVPLDVVPREGATAAFQVDLAGGIADGLHDANAWLRGGMKDVMAFSRGIIAGTVRTLVFFLLFFMLTAFMSMDAPRIVGFFESLVPRYWRSDYDRLLGGVDVGLAGVVRGQVTIMGINGFLTFGGLYLLQVPFAFALSFLATIFYVVPIFGTIISSIPIVLLALTVSFGKGLAALAWILVIHALETYVLNPKIMGEAARIHPVLIVLAIVVGERSAGIVGALLAVPVMSVFVAIFKFLHRKQLELDSTLKGNAR